MTENTTESIQKKPKYYIFRAWITKNGQRIWAKEYGYKAWRIPVY